LSFFGGMATARADPVRRVEEALRADPALAQPAVQELLDHYLRLRRARRTAFPVQRAVSAPSSNRDPRHQTEAPDSSPGASKPLDPA
jgi:hypothetical protein